MALKPCSECRKEVSTAAKACPHCGKQWPTGRPTGFLTYVVGGIIAFFVLGMVINSLSPTTTTSTTSSAASSAPGTAAKQAQETAEQRRGINAAIGARALKAMMRNPASFELIQALAMPNGWTCFKYRSQNGLGGMDVQQAFSIGGMVETHVASDFNKGWNHACGGRTGADVTTYTKYLLTQLPDK